VGTYFFRDGFDRLPPLKSFLGVNTAIVLYSYVLLLEKTSGHANTASATLDRPNPKKNKREQKTHIEHKYSINVLKGLSGEFHFCRSSPPRKK